jgi:hypothetical protein
LFGCLQKCLEGEMEKIGEIELEEAGFSKTRELHDGRERSPKQRRTPAVHDGGYGFY